VTAPVGRSILEERILFQSDLQLLIALAVTVRKWFEGEVGETRFCNLFPSIREEIFMVAEIFLC